MNIIDIALTVCIIAFVAFSIVAYNRSKKKSPGCCGGCECGSSEKQECGKCS